MLRFLADTYDDTSSTVFPFLSTVLLAVSLWSLSLLIAHQTQTTFSTKKPGKRLRTPFPIQRGRSSPPCWRSCWRNYGGMVMRIRQIWMRMIALHLRSYERYLQRVFWGRSRVTDSFLQDLRTFMDSVLVIDPSLVTGAVQTLAMNTLNAYQNGVAVKWNDAELAVYLVYIFGEINKCKPTFIINRTLAHLLSSAGGGKGRAAFCETPTAIDRDKRKLTDYSEFALTPHGQMLYTLVQSRISAYPHHTVTLQFFETTTRYTDFFKVRKECIMPTLHAMIDQRFVVRP